MWIVLSIRIRKLFFFVKIEINAITVVERSLHPSSAGNGRILSTQRFKESKATIRKNTFHVRPNSIICVKPAVIPIGPESISDASFLAVGVDGEIISLKVEIITS